MPFQYKPLEMKDFTGGFTDDYINADPRFGQVVKNLFVLNNKTLRTRFGTLIDSDVDPQIPAGTERINTLINYNNDDTLFAHSGKNIYFRNPTLFSTLLGPATIAPLPPVPAAVPFINADFQTHLAHTQWNRHLIITPENFDKPVKIYKDSADVIQLRTSGLPALASSPNVVSTGSYASGVVTSTLFTDLLTKNAHGFPTGLKVRFTNVGGALPAPLLAGVDYFVIVNTADTFWVADSLANALIGFDARIVLTTAGTGTSTVIPQSGDGAFVYAFIHKYDYTVYDESFIDFGPVTLVQLLDVNSPDIDTVNITAIPVLANLSGDNYDVNNIKIQIYRTINGGQEFYLIGEISNGTTTFNDSFSDDTIQNNQVLYTSGGVPENDPPPLAKFCHSVNGFTYYGNIKVGSEVFPSIIRQSQGLDPDSVPASFEDQLEDDMMGISSVQDVPIVGCIKHVYRIDGFFDEVGRGGMSHRRISDHAGCVSHESFVQAEGGLYWWGNDGIYYTEGFKCLKVTDHVTTSYKNFKDTLVDKQRKIKGVFDPETRSIYWTFSQNIKTVGQEECDSIWVLDLTWGISSEMTCFIWQGISTFSPTSLVIFNSLLHRADKTGYILKFVENSGADPKIVAGTPSTGWFFESIIYQFKSISTNFGSSFTRKTANKLLLDCISKTNVSIQINAINDEGKVIRAFTPIRYRKNFTWGDEEFVWGYPLFVWYYGGVISLDKRFPAKGLRFNFLQLDITNSFTNIINSDLIGLATIDATLNTATLVNAAGADWPSQSVDYFLFLEQDNFTFGYKVLDRTNDVLTLEDTLDTLVLGDQRWQLKGFKKGEILNLVDLSISWAETSRSYDTFNVGDAGGLV